MKLIDISQELFSAPVYPGDPEPTMKRISRIKDGDDCNLSGLSACLHAATHADAPLHFIEDGLGIDEMPLEKYIGPCTVLELAPGPVTGEMVDRLFPSPCYRLLLKSGGGAWLTQSAAYELAARRMLLLGTDAQSVGMGTEQAGPHRALLGGGVAILEGLRLDRVQPGQYFLIAPPVKIAGGDGAPVRALLLADHLFWSGGRA